MKVLKRIFVGIAIISSIPIVSAFIGGFVQGLKEEVSGREGIQTQPRTQAATQVQAQTQAESTSSLTGDGIKGKEIQEEHERLPPNEATFIKAVQEGKDAYHAAANDMQKGATRVKRKKAICKALNSMKVHSWLGQITTLSSSSSGKGVLAVQIAKNITLQTTNNALSDALEGTLIEPDTKLYESLSALKEGDRVLFSGDFRRGDSDCIEERSMTQYGSMTDPEFVFRFVSVAPYTDSPPKRD